MKRIYILTILLAVTVFSSMAQITKFFDKYSDVDGVTSVRVSKAMLEMMPDMKTEGMDMRGLAGKLDNILILTTENASMAAKLSKDAAASIDTKGCEELLSVNEGKERTKIYMKKNANDVNQYLIPNEDKSEFNAILITGKITPADIRAMINK